MDIRKEIESAEIKVKLLADLLAEIRKINYVDLDIAQILAIIEGFEQGIQSHLDAISHALKALENPKPD